PQPGPRPGDVGLAASGVLEMLGAVVVAVLGQPAAEVLAHVVAVAGQHLLVARAPFPGVGQRAVEVEEDSLRHGPPATIRLRWTPRRSTASSTWSPGRREGSS